MIKSTLFIILCCISNLAAQIPADTRQVVVGIANTTNSSHVTLSVFERNRAGQWTPKLNGWKGRLGRNGLAWGLGLHKNPAKQRQKKEGDGRAPAGIFRIGGAYGYAPNITRNKNLPYRQISSRDLWVEDSKSPNYNCHIILPTEPKTTWEKKAQMRQGDYAHSLKLFIAHNAPTKKKAAVANAGSSIFFHIWRGGGSKSTAGCTTMSPSKLKQLISIIDPNKKPVYVLLSKSDYLKYREAWKLP